MKDKKLITYKAFILLGGWLALFGVNQAYAQHEHNTKQEKKNTITNSQKSDTLNHSGISTSLPVSRIYAMKNVQPTGKRVEYDITIDEQTVNITGKPTWGLTLNGSIPGPTLTFTEGDWAVIRIHNKLKVETSVHWHGILLPNRQDGVSYLNTPPIEAGKTHTFEFQLVQTGTYWFHSHTGYQEQRGVYGSIVIHPQKPKYKVDKELVVVLSDWTNEKPNYILKNLKRGSEWYSIKKGNAQSLNRIIRNKAVGAYLRQSFDRMSPMDISDVYYERFLINGKDTSQYEEFKPGEKVRLRFINASGSTYQHVNFAGGNMTIIAADGLDVQPVEVDRILIAVAETYDVLVTIPKEGAFELRSTAQDGTGYASAWLGKGPRIHAPDIPKPNLYEMTRAMSSMPMGNMGAMFGKNARKAKRSDESFMALNSQYTPYEKMAGNMSRGMNHGNMDMGNNAQMQDSSQKNMNHEGMKMNDMNMENSPRPDTTTNKPEEKQPDSMNHQGMDHGNMDMQDHSQMQDSTKEKNSMQHQGMNMNDMNMQNHAAMQETATNETAKQMNHEGMNMQGMDMQNMGAMNMLGAINTPNYGQLKSEEKIVFPADRPLREYTLVLSGDMRRYIWGINGRTLSQDEKILIKRGEIVRFRMVNGTMMLHPMHLHGHFFRVVNGQGDYSPLKHTVNVSPMETVVIEFLADEEKDWFFHCHLLYHMLAGMARAVSYEGSQPDSDMVAIKKLHMRDMRDNQLFFWGRADIGYPTSYLNTNFSNNKNAVIIGGDVNWNGKFEIDADYERYFTQNFRVFAGIDAGNEEFLRRVRNRGDEGVITDRQIIRPVLGVRYLLPFLIDSEVKFDTRGNVRFQLTGEQQLFPRIILGYEGQWLLGEYVRLRLDVDYMLTKNFALFGNYDTRYSTFSGGVSYRF